MQYIFLEKNLIFMFFLAVKDNKFDVKLDNANAFLFLSCFARYSGFIKTNAKPRRIAFTTQRLVSLI
jgi:hypothetical protein